MSTSGKRPAAGSVLAASNEKTGMSDLTLAAAQSPSERGNLEKNVSEHVRFIEAAGSMGVDLLVFPELSLTGYELDLASAQPLSRDDPGIEPLKRAAMKHGMHVLVGGPLQSGLDKPYLAAFLLSSGPTICYAKMHVHESEQPYFSSGKQGCTVDLRGATIGVAICADTGFSSHAAEAAARGAQLYVASVMKTESEFSAHAQKLAEYAVRHRMAVLTSNYADDSGGAVSAGRSGFWDEQGRLVVQAAGNHRALVLVRRDGDGWSGEVIGDL